MMNLTRVKEKVTKEILSKKTGILQKNSPKPYITSKIRTQKASESTAQKKVGKK